MRQWLASNTGLKVIALTLAVFLWFFVRAVTSDSRTVEGVPVEVKAAPGMAVTYVSPKTVNVTVRGSTEDIRQASRYEIFAVLDFQRDERPGRLQAVLTTRDIRHPRRVQVMSVEPTNITIRLEKTTD
ncbi:MAG: CdaR family protein [Verrucomicrobiota bacterium]